MHVHDDNGSARLCAPARHQRMFGRLLEVLIDGEHDILARFGMVPEVLRLAIALAVDQHRLRSGRSAELGVVAGLNPDHAPVIGQPVGEIGFLALRRTVVAPQIAQHMGRCFAEGINARRLQFQIRSEAVGERLLKACDLRFAEVGQQRIGQGPCFLVGPLEPAGIHRQWLAQRLADSSRKRGNDAQPGLRAEALDLVFSEGELFPFGFREPPAELFFLSSDGGPLPGERLLAERRIGRVEGLAQVVQIKAQIVARPVFGQHPPLPVEDFPAHGGDPDCAIRLGLQMRLVFVRGNNLHPPQAR